MPIVVALNKIDLPNVNDSTRSTASSRSRGSSPWSGAATRRSSRPRRSTGQGIPDLLATLEIVAELHELKADPTRPATGTCLEASLSEGRGVVATVLVQDGTLRRRRRDRLRRRLRPRPRPVRRQGPLDRRGRPVDARRGLGPRRRAHRRREVRRRRRHLPRPRDRRDPPRPRPATSPSPSARPSRSRTSTARWPSRRSRAST